jgi:hypothetical protein
MAIQQDDSQHREAIFKKATATALTIKGMTAQERKLNPNPNFADDYNRTLELAKKAKPKIDEKIWPPTVTTTKKALVEECSATYSEIQAYCHQISSLIYP